MTTTNAPNSKAWAQLTADHRARLEQQAATPPDAPAIGELSADDLEALAAASPAQAKTPRTEQDCSADDSGISPSKTKNKIGKATWQPQPPC